MGGRGKKHEPMSAKALSQRLKWRGLQKLKFYCQLCEKQMRDDNGMKCHMMSEQHQRNMLIACESPEKYIAEYSQLFHRDYMALLKRRWGTTRVHCNVVYCEYVAHKTHYHMNATQWTTLTQYVQWLGENGYCKVDYQDEGDLGSNRTGWYVQYIDRDPEVERRKKELERLARKQKDMDERHNSKIAEMVARDQEKRDELDMLNELKPGADEVELEDENREKIAISLPGSRKIVEKYQENVLKEGQEGFKALVAQMSYKKSGVEAGSGASSSQWKSSSSKVSQPKKLSNLQEIMIENERQKEVAKKLEEEKNRKPEDEDMGGLTQQELAEMKEQREFEETWRANRTRKELTNKAKYLELSKTIDPKFYYRPGEKERIKHHEETWEKQAANKRKRLEELGPELKTVSGSGLEIKKSKKSGGEEELPPTLPDGENSEESDSEDDGEKPWLAVNIAVKITSKALGDKFYKKKGKVVDIVDKFEAIVQMFKTNVKIKIDQTHLETVIGRRDYQIEKF